MCIHEGCKKCPIYNLEGQKAKYCFTHKLEGMVNVKSTRCIHDGCKTRPNFNLEGQKATYCSIHKLEGMVDVRHPRCIHEGCKKQSTFNLEGQNAKYCIIHKLDGMVDVRHPRCIHEGCKTRPTFNIEGEKAKYCSVHKLEGMVDVTHPRCKSLWCFTRVHQKYDGYCLYCYINLFPGKPVSRNYKTKEYAVVEFVKEKFKFNWIADKIINGGCSRRRPDLLLDLMTHIIIIEVDENQHVMYDCSCENKRIMELSQDLGHRPIVFIRFNPDEYFTHKNITSCWGQDKHGICVVKKSKIKEWESRLTTLEQTVQYWINYSTEKTIEVVELFYDTNV
jgi:plastocyanin